MLLSKIEACSLDEDRIKKILLSFPKDDQVRGDIIFVFGNGATIEQRVAKAVQLYNQKRASKILFSGGVVTKPTGKVEAILMKEKAIALGVPEEDIWVETESLNTAQNVIASMFTIEKNMHIASVKHILIVTTSLHMKRCLLTLSRYMPKWITYSCCHDNYLSPEHIDWKKNKRVWDLANMETKNAISYVREGYISDIDIDL